MSSEQDVFTRLSRILETSDYQNKDDKEWEDIIMQVASPILGSKSDDRKKIDHKGAHGSSSNSNMNSNNSSSSKENNAKIVLPDRPTNYEIWQARQKMAEPITKPASQVKLTTQQIDRMINKMHRMNRMKQDEVVRVQNEGLREELGGYKFKPDINSKSNTPPAAKDESTLKERIESQKNKSLLLSASKTSKKSKVSAGTDSGWCKYLKLASGSGSGSGAGNQDKPEKEFIQLGAGLGKLTENAGTENGEEREPFKPKREGSKMSDKYLEKMKRTATARPEDFFNYQKEKERRNEQRKQIIDEIEAKHLKFTPTLPQSTYLKHQSLALNNSLEYDPITRLSKVVHRQSVRHSNLDDEECILGPTLLLKSEHPYRNNMDEHTVIAVPGAVSYSISFREGTSTEPVHDYVRFLKFENYEIIHGCGKYSGGLEKEEEFFDPQIGTTVKVRKPSSSNWCGLGGRPPLIINASKFVLHFKTNREVTDYGFEVEVVPTVNTFLALSANEKSATFQPEITIRGSQKVGSNTSFSSVHDRLYSDAVEERHAKHNRIAELVKGKLNLSMPLWEQEREKHGQQKWTGHKNHSPKSHLSSTFDDLLTNGGQPTLAWVDYDDEIQPIWKSLKSAKKIGK